MATKREKIYIVEKNEKLCFYLTSEAGRFFLFTQKFTKGVYDYFKDGKSLKALFEYRGWNRNPRLDKTIEKIPLYIKYVAQEEQLRIGKSADSPQGLIIQPKRRRLSQTRR